MVADIFEDFDPPSKKFLATPLSLSHFVIPDALCNNNLLLLHCAIRNMSKKSYEYELSHFVIR